MLKVNNKELDRYNEGIIFDFENDDSFILTDEEGKEYKSVYDYAKSKGKYYDAMSNGTESYHHLGTAFDRFVYTDSVSDFIKEHNAYWIITLIQSYWNFSTVVTKIDRSGHIEWVENKKGKDNFYYCIIKKTSKNTAVFSIDTDKNDGVRTKVFQNIPFTDLDTDYLMFYVQDGVIMFPSDY